MTHYDVNEQEVIEEVGANRSKTSKQNPDERRLWKTFQKVLELPKKDTRHCAHDLYGVETKKLVQAVKRNIDRFPDDVMFQLTKQEFTVLRS